MKHQQVVVDYWKMLQTSILFALLACSGYIFLKTLQAIFLLPRYLENNQRRLEELAKTYSKKLKDQVEEPAKETKDEVSTALEEIKPETKKEQ